MKTIRSFLLIGGLAVACPLTVRTAEPVPPTPGPPPQTTTAQSATTRPAATTPKRATGYPVIGHLEQRNRTITLKAGPQGTLYVVKSKDGKVLAAESTLEELKAQLPEVYDFLRTATGKAKPGKLPANDAALRLDGRVR